MRFANQLNEREPRSEKFVKVRVTNRIIPYMKHLCALARLCARSMQTMFSRSPIIPQVSSSQTTVPMLSRSRRLTRSYAARGDGPPPTDRECFVDFYKNFNDLTSVLNISIRRTIDAQIRSGVEKKNRNSITNMKFRALGVFIVIVAIAGGSYAENIDSGGVVFANILFRHGDRTPIHPYPTDPYRNESSWPVPFSQLTNLGKHQHLMLGRWFRQRYDHLLSETYSPYEIYVMSTDVDRTLMSAEANLAGLYPPRGKQIWDKLKWMPIPVHTTPQEQDYILAGKKFCPKYNYEMSKLLKSPEIQRIYRDNAEIFNYLTEKTGEKIEDLQNLEYIYNTLYIETLFNKTLPEWTKSIYPEKLEPLASLSFKLPAYNRILAKLKSGSLLGQMIDHMEKKSKNALSPDRKIWMYSAHDETLANMLMTLNVFESHCPPYASAILVELRKNSEGQHLVTVSYKNSSGEPTLLTIPGCPAFCPLESFVKLTRDVVPEDWNKECLVDSSLYGYNVSNSAIIAILSWSVLFLVSLVLLIIGFVYTQYRRDSRQYYLRLSTDPI